MDIKQIAKKIQENGGCLYLVGGAVRDSFLGRINHDEDYVVTGIESSDFEKLFPEAFKRGKSFEVFDIEGKEFAIARKERKTGLGHKEFEIEANSKITIEEDLARRDITINSIAQNVLTGEIVDPFNGKEDIKNKIIRKTTNHFREDPLRVYRVARFGAELEFEISEDTIKEMNILRNELIELSAERVFTEFRKALLAKKPSIFFDSLRKANVLDIHFKEIFNLIDVEQPKLYHPEGDAYNHTMLVVNYAAKLTENYDSDRKAEIRFAALVHDFGKALTPKEEYPHHYGHESNGIKPIRDFSNRLKVPNRFIKCGKTSSIEHMRGGIFERMKPSTKVDFLERVSKSILGLDGLQIIVYSDRLSNEYLKQEKENSVLDFEKIGKEMLKDVEGERIKQKYNLQEGIVLKNKIREERIKWMKCRIKDK